MRALPSRVDGRIRTQHDLLRSVRGAGAHFEAAPWSVAGERLDEPGAATSAGGPSRACVCVPACMHAVVRPSPRPARPRPMHRRMHASPQCLVGRGSRAAPVALPRALPLPLSLSLPLPAVVSLAGWLFLSLTSIAPKAMANCCISSVLSSPSIHVHRRRLYIRRAAAPALHCTALCMHPASSRGEREAQTQT